MVTEPRAERPRMPDYGVDTAEWEPLPWSWAAERLVANKNFWVVTASASGRPHAMPVWGVWDDGEHRFVFHCGPRARKAANLLANPQMVVMADDTVETISIDGSASLLEDHDRQDIWIERYLAKYQPMEPELSAGFLREGLTFEMVPERAFGIIETPEEFSTRATRWRF